MIFTIIVNLLNGSLYMQLKKSHTDVCGINKRIYYVSYTKIKEEYNA